MTLADRLIKQRLDDGMILAPEGGQRLFVMNSTAAFIWELLEGGVPAGDIPRRLAAGYGIAPAQAEIDFELTYSLWLRDGLVREGSWTSRRFRLAAMDFSIACFDARCAALVHSIFSHLEIPASERAAARGSREFQVASEEPDLILRADGAELRRSRTSDEIIERLVAEVMQSAYDSVDWLVSIHAAALASDTRAILLPGRSGSGKSTLAAGLLARGRLRLLSDDIALLDRESLRVWPMPGPVVLKQGSWNLVDPMPGPAAASYRRGGQPVRYLAPARDRLADSLLPACAVVFPERGTVERDALVPISPREGLQRLLAAPATIRGPLTREAVTRLAEWAGSLPFFVLQYDTLDQAARRIEHLLAS